MTFQGFTEIQNGRHRSTLIFFAGTKTQELKIRNYSHFKITFPQYFFKDFAEIQNDRHGSTS